MSKYSAVKGMNDLLPPQSDTWHFLERTARETLANYGYAEVRTPIGEATEHFPRSVGEGPATRAQGMYNRPSKGHRRW